DRPHQLKSPLLNPKMKRILTLLSAVALTLVLISPAQAGKGNKAAAGDAPKMGKILKTYDTNGDGKIDGAEAEALKKAFASDASLKGLDKDKDGKLSDEEIAAIHGHKKK